MSKPLEGVRVLEVAMYGFVPSAGAVLAEWGADVIKVEHAVTGDPQRGLRQTGLLRVEGDPNPNIEHANRLKRSIGLDMSVPEGREILLELAKKADVFLTSDLRHHAVSDARESTGLALCDVGHFATEWPWLPVAADVLHRDLSGRVEVAVSRRRTDPWTWHEGSDGVPAGQSAG